MPALEKLYVGNLPWRTSDEDFSELFRDFGPIHSQTLVMSDETGLCRGYGFVVLDESNANEAIRVLENSNFMGRTLKVSKAVGRQPRKQNFCGVCEPAADYYSINAEPRRQDPEPRRPEWDFKKRGCSMSRCILYSMCRDNAGYRHPERE